MFDLDCIDHVAITVTDVRRSAAWYEEVLGLRREFEEQWGDHPAFVGIGKTFIAMFPVSTEQPNPPPGRDTLSMRHIAFRTDGKNFKKAQSELSDRKIEFQFQDHDRAHSIYFRDPDGHEIEITTYDL
jgi:catechol 2,3-dioxygenase-like lactoylglutathione lyase family enzyme